ncbi:MAG TPA: DoxX-like family protein [Burkholderiaceae bacterium]
MATHRLYWAARLGMAFLWLWTAASCWFFFPHEQSIAWLRRLGIAFHTDLFFAAACVLDFAMGLAALFLASRKLWQTQMMLVAFYSIVVAFGLPEFLFEPFGPLSKNLTVLVCLGLLAALEGESCPETTRRKCL